MRHLTKSRFKLALDCPTRLHYADHGDYFDRSEGNSFLAALAEGGYQVGALACAVHPDGIEVDDVGHAAQVARTHALLQRENVTIFEAALAFDGLFVRVDILRKRGRRIELVEVKAKSYDPRADRDFRAAGGRLQPEWLPYLRDIAFQAHVAALAMPAFEYHHFLMLVDTSATASVDGLNQRFPIEREGRQVRVRRPADTAAAPLGDDILVAVPVDHAVAEILAGTLTLGADVLPFVDAVDRLARACRTGERLAPVPGTQCAGCQFKRPTPPAAGESPRSGFHECWSEAFGWGPDDFAGGTVLDVWNFRKKRELLERGVLKPQGVTREDLGHDGAAPGPDGMSAAHRQWYQCHGGWPGGGEHFFDVPGLSAAMAGWRYPLHFIDFETAAVAIPFTRGRRPYETLAFQFSHHVMHADGRVEHRSQFLQARPGVDPNLAFLRALRDALAGDDGTVFRWATHENTVLNQLRRRLLDDPSPPPDAPALVAFVDSITTRHDGWTGPRNMVDLCKLAERHYFHPSTRGSSSLKKVLPALMRSSHMLRETYGRPAYGSAAMPSLNLHEPTCWWVPTAGGVRDPYDLLPPVFDDVPAPGDEAASGTLPAELQEGGSAMAAYACLQSERLPDAQRRAIESALLRYCELDTLAMVMAVQAWTAWCAGRP